MKKIGTQSIETKRLLLRPFLESDAPAMYDNWASRPDNLLHVTWDAHESPEVTQQSIARWVENYQNLDFYKWAICLNTVRQTNSDKAVAIVTSLSPHFLYSQLS